MPQLRLFGRRWRLAADTLPILGVSLTAVHIGILVPCLYLFVLAEGSGYSCNAETIVRVSIWATLICNTLSMMNDVVLIPIGLQGGPLEESKRKAMRPLLYSRILLYVFNISFLIFATVVLNDPDVRSNCWAGNPCPEVPTVCDGDQLTPSCLLLYKSKVSTIEECTNLWFNLAASYAKKSFNEDDMEYWYPSEVQGSTCEDTEIADSAAFEEWIRSTNQTLPLYKGTTDVFQPSGQDVMTALKWLEIMGLAHDGGNYTSMLDVPWGSCLSEDCTSIILSIENCTSYGDMLAYGQKNNEVSKADVAVYGSWVIQVTILLVFVLAFNAFPDYNNPDSWTYRVRGMSRLMCCSRVLKTAKTDDGQDADEGLGKLLLTIFGGIDLDITDEILGFLLVSERQRWRRWTSVVGSLEKAGYKYVPKNGFWRSADQLASQARSLFKATNVNTNLTAFQEGEVHSTSELVNMFVPQAGLESNVKPCEGTSFVAPTLYHSFLRRDSSTVSNHGNEVYSCEDGESQAIQKVPAGTSKRQGINLDLRASVLLTPYLFEEDCFDPKLTCLEAAKIYIGSDFDRVPSSIIQEALKFSKVARAAYGLQAAPWKASKPSTSSGRIVDTFLSYFKPILPSSAVRNHFKKRNMDAILRMTESDPEDLLHVSYASSALGLLPYFIMLDKESKAVILTIRGTVGFADLITDLLSTPFDAFNSMPKWVKTKLKDEPIFAHAGILSAANAILQDMESKNLLLSMSGALVDASDYQGSNFSRNYAEYLESLHDNDEVELPLERAHSALSAVASDTKWKLVITGHSLGAAVATIISFHLKERFPDLRCFAFNPPGGLMGANLSNLSESFCTSVIVGHDLISRLSLVTMEKVVDDMVLALGRCKRQKLFIFGDILFGRRKDPATIPPTFCSFEDISEEASEVLQEYVNTSALHRNSKEQRNLFPPGKLIYLRAFVETDGQETWDAIWIDKKGASIISNIFLVNLKNINNVLQIF